MLGIDPNTNFVYSLRGRGFFKIPRPLFKMPCPFLQMKMLLAEQGQSNYNGNRHSKRGRMHMRSMILCYNLKGTKKGRKLGMLGSFLGFRIKYVEKEEYLKSIGELTGLINEKETMDSQISEQQDTEAFEEEMIVIQMEDHRMLDKLLFQMRKEKVQIPLKAVVTAQNQNWTSEALYKEIKKEHETMMKLEKEKQEAGSQG